MNPDTVFVAHTDREWFDNLSRLATPTPGGPVRVDEVNFWSPRSPKAIKAFALGEPVFFRLGKGRGPGHGYGHRMIAGYGFFAAHLDTIDVHLAWQLFGPKNGADTFSEFARILGRLTPASWRERLGTMILRDATFWPEPRWIPWGTERDYASSGVQRGRTDANPAHVALLMAEVRRDAVARPADLDDAYRLVAVDGRRRVLAEQVRREGQGTFRARLLKAYEGQCAITGEHTEPVLDAAHIQPYLGPASNHVQNGLLLTQEFHTLFDRGLVCVEDKDDVYRLRVSSLLQERWNNGRRYREYEGKRLFVPGEASLRPSREALAWHREVCFEREVA